MRRAIAMIELIFAIVIIAISVMTIPSMVAVGAEASRGAVLNADVMARLNGWVIERFQARWDGGYLPSGSRILGIVDPVLGCNRNNFLYRNNPASEIACDINDTIAPPAPPVNPPSAIPANGSGNLTFGLEQLNGGSETITITPSGGTAYNVVASYAVDYVNSAIVVAGNNANAVWTIGSSTAMRPNALPGGTLSHLKRVVTNFDNNKPHASDRLNVTLTFFKSNKGN